MARGCGDQVHGTHHIVTSSEHCDSATLYYHCSSQPGQWAVGGGDTSTFPGPEQSGEWSVPPPPPPPALWASEVRALFSHSVV